MNYRLAKENDIERICNLVSDAIDNMKTSIFSS